MATRINIYLECGKKRTFAGAPDWPGWCCQGRDETDALAALVACGPKYASILARTGLGFVAPKHLSEITVIERLPGTATTDFGAPAVAPTVDRERSCDAAGLKRCEKILRAGWRAFDEAVSSARERTLATGPRGGGRKLEAIVAHVIEADASYLSAVGWKAPKRAMSAEPAKPSEQLSATRESIIAALRASAAGEIPARGPRGGVRWTARYFVRRVAWHVIAHMWEIQRRASP